MNIGRSEYTRLIRREVRLKKAESLLKECYEGLDGLFKVLGTEDQKIPEVINEIKFFLEEE